MELRFCARSYETGADRWTLQVTGRKIISGKFGSMKRVIKDVDVVLARTEDARRIALMSKELVEAGLGWRWTVPRVLSSIRNPDHNVAVVRQGGRVVAFGIMQYGFEEAHLLLFAVQTNRRRQKIGSRLLRWLEETAMVAGADAIYLETRMSNRGGRSFYRAHGYEELGVLPGYYSGRESAVRMVRKLRPGYQSAEL